MAGSQLVRPGDLGDFLEEMREETKNWEPYSNVIEGNAKFFADNEFLIPVFLNYYAFHNVKQNHGGWLVVSGLGTDEQNCGGDLESLLNQIGEEFESHELWDAWNDKWKQFYSQIPEFDQRVIGSFIYLVAEQYFGSLSLVGTQEDFDKLKPKEMPPEMAELISKLRAGLAGD